MTHNRDTAFHNPPYLFRYSYTAFKLNRLGSSLLNETGRILERFLNASVIGHEWHIADYQHLFGTSNYGLGMVEHLLHSYRYS
ncbi:hypothetical protein ES705_50294 [subsurface metagenome]